MEVFTAARIEKQFTPSFTLQPHTPSANIHQKKECKWPDCSAFIWNGSIDNQSSFDPLKMRHTLYCIAEMNSTAIPESDPPDILPPQVNIGSIHFFYQRENSFLFRMCSLINTCLDLIHLWAPWVNHPHPLYFYPMPFHPSIPHYSPHRLRKRMIVVDTECILRERM